MEIGHTEIDIEASKEAVWRVLTDFGAYPEWNPFLTGVRGELRLGSRLAIGMTAPGMSGSRIHATVIRLDDSPQVRWLSRKVLPGVLDCEHCLIVEEFRPQRVRFFQRFKWSGALVGWSEKRMEACRLGAEAMNRALQQRVYSLA